MKIDRVSIVSFPTNEERTEFVNKIKVEKGFMIEPLGEDIFESRNRTKSKMEDCNFGTQI